MISREELSTLAAVESPKACAISFYFQPETPQDVSHRREALQVKELVRDAQRRFERNGIGNHVREDLDRILNIAEQIQGNGKRAKVIFACADKNIWREFDLPANLGRTQLFVNSRFHLGPLAAAVLSRKPVCVVLADREHFRIFDYDAGELRELEHVIDDVPRKVRTNGFAGYNAGHMERHVDNEAMKHFKKLAARLQEKHSQYECFAFGGRADAWPEIEAHLHTYVKQRLIGTFVADPVLASAEEVREHVDALLREHTRAEQEGIVRETMGETQRNGRGSLGLRHVITSLERGEVQSLLIGRNFEAKAVECTNCGHLDTRLVEKCAVCTQETRELDNVVDALVGRALTSAYDIVFVEDDPDFERSGGIGALLRFRADQNTPEKLAV